MFEAVERPLNVLLRPDGPTVDEPAGAGVARISVGGRLSQIAHGAVARAARELLAPGPYRFTELAEEGGDAPEAAFGRYPASGRRQHLRHHAAYCVQLDR